MSDAMDGKRAVKLGKEEVQKRLADGSAYLDVVVKGKWRYRKTGISTCVIECSECKYALYKGNSDPDLDRFIRETQAMMAAKGLNLDNFCPNCGADMREGDT